MLAQDLPAARRPFDAAAQSYVALRFGKCHPAEFVRELCSFAPNSRRSESAFEMYFGWACYDLGDYAGARSHLVRSLRLTASGSRERAMVRGLIAETLLSSGRMQQAERCAHRALAQLPAEDPGHYLRGGFLLVLGRLYRRQGHLSHAIESYRRGLSFVEAKSDHRPLLTCNLAFALALRGRYHEADALLSPYRDPAATRDTRAAGWGPAAATLEIALGLGDLERAADVLERAEAMHAGAMDERGRLVLTYSRAIVNRARGEWAEAEARDREVLAHCRPGGRNTDLIGTAANGLAESLEGQRRHAEALEAAELAVQAGSTEDWYEWARGLHARARNLAALGRRDEARRAFKEVLGMHERMQFEAEWGRLRESVVRLGFADLIRASSHAPAPHPCDSASLEVLRAPLADGREFVTTRRGQLDHIRAAARSDLPVIIEGETGTGKELVARLIHEGSSLRNAPLVIVDCSTMPPELADVELFGAARGAYTGAHRDRAGLVAEADGGTIFLDELPELPPALQAKLLRVLHEGTYRRIGEDRPRRTRLRVIAATNRGVDALVRAGALKADLFFRLNGHRILLEPLRERPDDIEVLSIDILRRCGIDEIAPDALARLRAHRWPGNVRQLEMVLRVAACHCPPGERIESHHLVLETPSDHEGGPLEDSLRSSRLAGEREALIKALRENGGVVTRAAHALGLTRQAFYKAMRRTGLRREEHDGADPVSDPAAR